MADVQRYFEAFHDKIKLGTFDEEADLRKKRDMLIDELKKKLDKDVPKFEEFNQGSYAIGTGTVPKNGNYDIDVGLIFDSTRAKYPDPVTLKKLVRDALTHGSRIVRIRQPCITVEYMKDGAVDYHVDLAVYAKRTDGVGLDLARGRESDAVAARVWEQNDPKGLVAQVNDRHSGDQAAQMRRVIRYLKRWRDHRFSNEEGPISVALTVACYHWFRAEVDIFANSKPVDIRAVQGVVDEMLRRFISSAGAPGTSTERLKIELPVVPNSDLLTGFSDSEMKRLRERLKALTAALSQAMAEPLPEKACRILAEQFGPDFPIPDPDDTAKKVKIPYVHAGTSA